MTTCDENLNVAFTVRQRIERPVAEVFQAVVDPEKLCRYFTKTADGPPIAGRTVHWTWADGDEADVHVLELDVNEKLVCSWKAWQVEQSTTWTMIFESLDGSATRLSVHETGWRSDQRGLESSYRHCHGWSHMLLCLKAHLEHGADLRSDQG
jgi:uncharacterized protein YndB with AHSA1/START domain